MMLTPSSADHARFGSGVSPDRPVVMAAVDFRKVRRGGSERGKGVVPFFFFRRGFKSDLGTKILEVQCASGIPSLFPRTTPRGPTGTENSNSGAGARMR